MAGFEIAAVDLDDVAGYEFEIKYGGDLLRAVPERTNRGDIFAGNPYGSVFETREVEGGVSVIASRVGKEWSARGDAVLAQLWFEVLADGGVGAIELGDGVLLDPAYRTREFSLGTALADLLLPAGPSLEQNFPNPFNPTTSIPISVPSLSLAARLDIYNVLGQRIRTLMAGPVGPGFYTIAWNGRDDAGRSVGAGLYFSVFETPEFRQTRKMMLIR